MIRIRRRRRPTTYPESVLATADDLMSAGKPLDAIRILTEANRAQRDRKIEHHLLALRHEAFRRITWPSETPSWPETVVDSFPGQLVPEIAREDLTVDAIRSGIRNHGSLLVRGLVG